MDDRRMRGFPHRLAHAIRWFVAPLAVVAVTIPMLVSPAQAAPPVPTFSVAPEDYAKYQPQTTCDMTPKPGVVDFRDLVLATYPGTTDMGITRSCELGELSEHKEGRAWDWGVSAATQGHVAWDLLNWLFATRDGHANALLRRLGIMYIIWDRQIFRAYSTTPGWQEYTGVNPHTDHVHFSFGWPAAHRQTTWWTGRGSSAEWWSLHQVNAGGQPRYVFSWDVPDSCSPVVGDWDGIGSDTIGASCPHGPEWAWAMLNGHHAGAPGYLFGWGSTRCLQGVGDWDGNGSDSPGTVCAAPNGEWQWALRNRNEPGGVDIGFGWGSADSCWPIVGDWNGDGSDTPGLVCPRGGEWQWALHDVNRAGGVEHAFGWGSTSCSPIVGDWDGNGTDTPGTVCGSAHGEWQWALHDFNRAGGVEHAFGWGSTTQRAIVGDWDGNGTTTPGTTTLRV